MCTRTHAYTVPKIEARGWIGWMSLAERHRRRRRSSPSVLVQQQSVRSIRIVGMMCESSVGVCFSVEVARVRLSISVTPSWLRDSVRARLAYVVCMRVFLQCSAARCSTNHNIDSFAAAATAACMLDAAQCCIV